VKAYLAGAGQAHETAHASDRLHFFRKLQAHIDNGSHRQGPLRFYQQTFHSDVHGFTFNLLAGDTQTHFRTHRHAPGSAALVFDSALGGAHQAQQAILVQRLVKKETGAGVEALGHRVRARIIADQNHRDHAV